MCQLKVMVKIEGQKSNNPSYPYTNFVKDIGGGMNRIQQ